MILIVKKSKQTSMVNGLHCVAFGALNGLRELISSISAWGIYIVCYSEDVENALGF